MYLLKIDEQELYDSERNKFIYLPAKTFHLEHSLEAIAKWESKYKTQLLTHSEKTPEQMAYYIKCMVIENLEDVNPSYFDCITTKQVKEIEEYMADPHTGTTLPKQKKRPGKGETMSAELIYYWMFSNGIPKECEKWHINNLLTLIQIFGIKGQTDQPGNGKATSSEYAARRALNAQRRAKFGSKG